MITITNYKIEDIDDWEDFVNNLFVGLKHYEKKNPDFRFKITLTGDNVELKTIKLNECIN